MREMMNVVNYYIGEKSEAPTAAAAELSASAHCAFRLNYNFYKFDNETLEFAFGSALGDVAQAEVLRSELDDLRESESKTIQY